MPNQPTGIVSFLFTDIQGSTKLWDKYPVGMLAALARHDAIMREAIEQHHSGYVFKTIGDAFCAAFPTSEDAVLATLQIQRALLAENWGEVGAVKVRMAVHTGEAECRDNDYFGGTLNRVARLRDTAHGGQVVVTAAVYQALSGKPGDFTFQDKGEHKLKDLSEAEHVYQLCAEGLPQDFPALRTLSSHPNNLPAATTSFIGREAVVQDIGARLDEEDTRLLTLTGFGGLGKTRLALRVGEKVLERFPEGVWFVPLAAIFEPALVVPTIARALGLKDEPDVPLLEQLTQHLAAARALLILDNFEQVEDAAEDVAAILRGCSDVKILVTSRSLLNLSMEYEFEVPPLDVTESVTLFAARARQARSAFAVDAENTRQVEELCRQLEGMPLAVELAAAQIRKLSVEAITLALSQRLEVLATNMRDLSPRQRSLRGAIEWSYELLKTGERTLFDALSVFVDGFDLEGVEAICGPACHGETDTLRLLLSLREQSLIGSAREGSQRFTLLESLRQYGAEQAEKTGASHTLRSRHREFFLKLAEQAEPELTGSDQAAWLDRLELEHGNLRAALQWCEVAKDCATQGLRMASLLTPFWDLRGYYREGRDTLAGLLELTASSEPAAERARALRSAGTLAWWQSDFDLAQTFFEQSLAMYRLLQDPQGMATALSGSGDVAFARGDYEAARDLQTQNLQICRELQDVQGIGIALNSLGNIASHQQDNDAARLYFLESLDILQKQGNLRYSAMALSNLGNIAYAQEDYEAACAYFEEGLKVQRALGDKLRIAASLFNLGNSAYNMEDYGGARALFLESTLLFQELGNKHYIALNLENFASLSIENLALNNPVCFDPKYAARLFGAAEVIRETIAFPVSPHHRAGYDSTVSEAREALGEEAFVAAWAAGRQMTMDEAIACALDGPGSG